MSDPGGTTPRRVRREPPRFRRVAVRGTAHLSPRMLRVTLGGDDLEGLVIHEPAASVRLLLPSPGEGGLVMPRWNGNEFLLADGRRPLIRTLTPRHLDTAALEVEVDVVLHGDGPLSTWASSAHAGDEVAVAGPGRGYAVDGTAPTFLVAGDETALPAVSQLLEVLPTAAAVHVHLEVAAPDGRLVLPPHPGAVVEWHDLPQGAPSGDRLVAAVAGAELAPGTRVWVAGEAAAMQRIRRIVLEERGVPRRHATIRGYWKHGRSGGDDT